MTKRNKERLIGLGYALFGAFAYCVGATKGLICYLMRIQHRILFLF